MDNREKLTEAYKRVEQAIKRVEEVHDARDKATAALNAANAEYAEELRNALLSLNVDPKRAYEYLAGYY